MAVGASSMLEAAPGLLLICSAAGVLAGSDPAHRAQLPAGARPPQVTVRALPVLQLLPIRAGAAPDLQQNRPRSVSDPDTSHNKNMMHKTFNKRLQFKTRLCIMREKKRTQSPEAGPMNTRKPAAAETIRKRGVQDAEKER